MFKKKGINNKKVDLHQETDGIVTTQIRNQESQQENQQNSQNRPDLPQEEHLSNGSRTPIYRLKAKNNIFTLEGLQKNQTTDTSKLNYNIFEHEQQKVECFTQFRKLKETEAVAQEQAYLQQSPVFEEQKREKLVIRVENNDLESEPEGLQIEIDEQGGFSPQLGYDGNQDYDDINGDYEDELIRKTLTKRNYDNLSKNGGISLHRMKQNEVKDSFLQKLKKINVGTIKKAISRDLHHKKLKLKELKEGLQEITSAGGNKKAQIELKAKRLKQLKEEQQSIAKVIEHIYYWGDKIKDFSISGIKKEIAEQQRKKNTYDQDQF